MQHHTIEFVFSYISVFSFLLFSLTWNYFRNISSNFAWNYYLKMHWYKHTCSHIHFTSKSDENYWWTILWWIGNMNWNLIAKMTETSEICRPNCNFTSGKMESQGTQDVWLNQAVCYLQKKKIYTQLASIYMNFITFKPQSISIKKTLI